MPLLFPSPSIVRSKQDISSMTGIIGSLLFESGNLPHPDSGWIPLFIKNPKVRSAFDENRVVDEIDNKHLFPRSTVIIHGA